MWFVPGVIPYQSINPCDIMIQPGTDRCKPGAHCLTSRLPPICLPGHSLISLPIAYHEQGEGITFCRSYPHVVASSATSTCERTCDDKRWMIRCWNRTKDHVKEGEQAQSTVGVNESARRMRRRTVAVDEEEEAAASLPMESAPATTRRGEMAT